VGLAFGALELRDLGDEAGEALLDDGEVAEHQLEVERLDVAGWVHRTVRVRVAGVLEGADDVDEGVGLGQVAEELAAHALLGHALGDAGHVEVLDIGGDGPLGLEHVGQDVEPGIRDLDGGQVRLVGGAGEAADGRLGAGQRVEDGRLPGAGQADDDELGGHGDPVWWCRCRRGRTPKYRPVGAIGANGGCQCPDFGGRW
jgi:hypothetical protein